MEQEFNALEAEKQEAKLLAEEGLIFETEVKSIFRIFKKKRFWHIKPLTFGTILQANLYAMELKLNLSDVTVNSAMHQMNSNIRPLMSYIAVSYLGSKWKIKFFKNIMTEYFLWRLAPEKALPLSLKIIQMYDLANFIASIRLIGTITSPMTKVEPSPNPIDGNKQDLNQ